MPNTSIPSRSDSLRARCACAIAIAFCLAPIACGPSDPLPALRAQQESGDFSGSVEPLRALLEKQPDNAEANYLYGRALVATQRAGLASWALRRAMQDPAWEVPAGLELANAALTTGDNNEAVEIATKVLEHDPDNVMALQTRASAHAHWRKDLEQALRDADRVFELDPDSIGAFEPRILALLSLDRVDEARAAMNDLAKRIKEVESPASTQAWYCATAAIFADESGETESARKQWDQCVADHPSSSDVVRPALDFYDSVGAYQRSVEVLRAAIAKAPDMLIYRAMLADRLRQAGKPADAEAVLLEAARVDDPRASSDAWLSVGKLRQLVGDRAGGADAIEQSIEKAREAGSVTPQLMLEYADALVLAGRLDQALEVTDQLTVPAHQHLIRARVFQEKGDPAGALAEYDKTFQVWPDNPWARYYAARAAEDVGDFERAMEEYRTSIRIDPAATDARTRAGQLMLADRKPRIASQLLRELDHKPLDAAGELLALRIAGRFGTSEEVASALKGVEGSDGRLSAAAVASLATGIAEGDSGPRGAVRAIRLAPYLDFKDPRDAAALRALVKYSHEAGERATPTELTKAVAAQPQLAVFQELRGLDLELAGKLDEARAAYSRAVEVNPNNPGALAGLGRLAAPSDPAQALDYFDRAAAADPSDPAAKLGAARALIAIGKQEEAAKRLDALLAAHPVEADAAALRASLDLDRGVATDQTLERARRAARFGAQPEALELLGRVYTKRGDSEQAEHASERARVLRAKEASKGTHSKPAGKAATRADEGAAG
jgi:tetratricopeptide (TPR) repeat protein